MYSTFAGYLLFFFLFFPFTFIIYLCTTPTYKTLKITLKHNFENIFCLHNNFYISLLLTQLCFSLVPFSFFYISEALTFPTDTAHCDIEFAFDYFAFLFHGLHCATTLIVLKPVLCFHMTSYNYGTEGVRDVDPDVIRAILCLIVSSVLTSRSG